VHGERVGARGVDPSGHRRPAAAQGRRPRVRQSGRLRPGAPPAARAGAPRRGLDAPPLELIVERVDSQLVEGGSGVSAVVASAPELERPTSSLDREQFLLGEVARIAPVAGRVVEVALADVLGAHAERPAGGILVEPPSAAKNLMAACPLFVSEVGHRLRPCRLGPPSGLSLSPR
jgi:hypothetical protein